MTDWNVQLADEFEEEFDELEESVQDELLAYMRLVECHGPSLKRPHSDTLNGSKHANMKELRFHIDQSPWRFLYAFDPQRNAIIFCGGSKGGVKEERFYKKLISKADKRFAAHLERLDCQKKDSD